MGKDRIPDKASDADFSIIVTKKLWPVLGIVAKSVSAGLNAVKGA